MLVCGSCLFLGRIKSTNLFYSFVILQNTLRVILAREPAWLPGMSDSFVFCLRLKRRWELQPGVAFGEGREGSVRICYAVDRAALEPAIERLNSFLASWREKLKTKSTPKTQRRKPRRKRGLI
jgi:hypothetical protein